MAKISSPKHKRKPKLTKGKFKIKNKKVKSSKLPKVKSQSNTSDSVGLTLETLKNNSVLNTSKEIPIVQSKNTQPTEDKKIAQNLSAQQFAERFPVFKDELIKKFLGVAMTNNQKGRIRQTLRDSMKGTSETLLPDMMHNRVQAIVEQSDSLTDAELRKIRILYNMLKSTMETKTDDTKVTKSKKKGKNKKPDKSGVDANKAIDTENKNTEDKIDSDDKEDIKLEDKNDDDKEDVKMKDVDGEDVKMEDKQESDDKGDAKIGIDKKQDKVKGPKRYVVFVGNLPLNVDKEKLMKHFKDLDKFIVDVRIPELKEGKKSCIAYLEVKNELCYEMALSKHHSMFGNKRINVLYTTQKNSKITPAEAKSKSAKLIALQQRGQLAGSAPLRTKRSQRRKRARLAAAQLGDGN